MTEQEILLRFGGAKDLIKIQQEYSKLMAQITAGMKKASAVNKQAADTLSPGRIQGYTAQIKQMTSAWDATARATGNYKGALQAATKEAMRLSSMRKDSPESRQALESLNQYVSRLREEVAKREQIRNSTQAQTMALRQQRVEIAKGTLDLGRQKQAFRENTAEIRSQEKALNSGIRTLARMAGAYISIGAAIKAVNTGVEFNKMIEQNVMAFTVMLKSSTLAEGLMQKFRALQTTSGIGIREASGAARQLLAYGFQEGDLIANMKMLKTVAGAVGAPLQDIAYVYGTLRTQGRAYTRDLMQFAMRGIPIYESLAQVLGVDASAIKQMTEDGKIGFKEVEMAIQKMTGAGGVFAGMLEARMLTLTGQTELLGFEFETFMGKMTAPVASPLMDLVKDLITFLRTADTTSFGNNMAEMLKNFKPAIEAIVAALFQMARAFAELLKIASGPLSVIITGFAKIVEFISWIIANPIGGAFAWVTIAAVGFASLANGISAAATATGVLGKAMTGLGGIATTIGANPLILAIAALATVGVVTFQLIKEAGDAQKSQIASNLKSGSALTREQSNRLIADIASIGTSGTGLGGRAAVGIKEIKTLAEQYGVSFEQMAKVIREKGYLTKQAFDELSFQLSYGSRAPITGPLNPYALNMAAMGQQYTPVRSPQREATAADILRARGSSGVSPTQRSQMAGMLSSLSAEDRAAASQLLQGPSTGESISAKKAQLAALQGAYEQQQALINAETKGSPAFNRAVEARTTNLELQKTLVTEILTLEKDTGKVVTEDMWIERELAAKLSEDRLDDIQLEYAKRVESFTKQAAAEKWTDAKLQRVLAADQMLMAKEVSDYKKQLMEEEKAKRIALAQEAVRNPVTGLFAGGITALQENAGGFIQHQQAQSKSGMGSIAGTIDNVLGAGINIAGAGLLQLGQTILEQTGIFDLFTPIVESAVAALKPLVAVFSQILGPAIKTIAGMFAVILKPVMKLAAGLFPALAQILAQLQPLFEAVGTVLSWVYDAIVWVANGFIDLYNWINIFGEDIQHLKTSAELDALATAAEQAAAAFEQTSKDFDDTMAYLKDAINKEFDKRETALQSLYEVGAITAQAYAQQSRANYEERIAALGQQTVVDQLKMANLSLESLIQLQAAGLALQAIQSNTTLSETQKQVAMADWATMISAVSAGGDVSTAIGTFNSANNISNLTAEQQAALEAQAAADAAALAAERAQFRADLEAARRDRANRGEGYAVGTTGVPYDMLANVHQDEMIIPRGISQEAKAEGIYIGPAKSTTYSKDQAPIVVYLNVEGSVTAERDLASTVAKAIQEGRSGGYITR